MSATIARNGIGTRAVVPLRAVVAAWCLVFFTASFALAQEPGDDKPAPPAAESETPDESKAPADSKASAETEKSDTRAKSDADKPEASAQKDAESPAPSDKEAEASTSAERTGPTDPAELEAFIDGIMAVQMNDKHIAGATVSVVVDDQPFFEKGYGYADVEAKKPVDPEKTMFRIGSVSKLFTWTAVMQLVEEGKLDLDADINTYLKDFKVPNTFAEPITLRHLMTHTPGFEDRVLGLFAHEPEKVQPLGKVLANDIPARVRKPGELASYSNHGTAIAGYIVSEVSGMPWEDYVEEKILKPLGMEHTMVRQPAADEMPDDMSKGYKFKNGRFEEEGFEYIPLSAAGAVSSSAGDMTRFMIAHLQDGRYDDTRILKEETARQMRELVFTHDKRIDGMAYGFMRLKYNGEDIVHHGGDTQLFHTFFVLLPERKAGFFVSYNTDTGTVRRQLLEAFLDRYFPAEPRPDRAEAQRKPTTGRKIPLERFVGEYAGNRYSHTTPTKLARLFGLVKVSADDNQLVVRGLDENPKRFVEVEPLLFREVDDSDTLAFRENDQGQVTQLFLGQVPIASFEKLQWNETPRFALVLVAGCAALFLSAVIGWPWAAFIAWGAPREATFASHLASWVAWITSLVALGWLAALMFLLRDPDELVYGTTPPVDWLLWASPAIAALVALVVVFGLVAWLRGYWRFSGRLHYTLVLAAGVAFVWFLHHWNLMQFTA